MAAVDMFGSRSRSSPPPTVSSPRCDDAEPAIRIADGAFVAETTVDGWARSGAATRSGVLLTAHDGRRFLLRDAVRIIGRRNGDTDPYGFTGRVDAIREFIRQGATVSVDALRLGHSVYDLEYGFVVAAADASLAPRVM
jgi:hypothetical protein